MCPETRNIREICLQLLNSVLKPHSAAYVAGPLDSGQHYYELIHNGNNPKVDIRKKNQKQLTRFAQELRNHLPYPVIDPGPLRVSGWKGSDYASFFLEVIDHYVKEVWFIDGWEFSIGATNEFVFCINKGLPCLNESGEKITPYAGKMLIEKAVSSIDTLKKDSSKLQLRIQELENVLR